MWIQCCSAPKCYGHCASTENMQCLVAYSKHTVVGRSISYNWLRMYIHIYIFFKRKILQQSLVIPFCTLTPKSESSMRWNKIKLTWNLSAIMQLNIQLLKHQNTLRWNFNHRNTTEKFKQIMSQQSQKE